VTDVEILDAWRSLRTLEGVFSEPASAAGIAGLAHGPAAQGGRVVCIVTGHGLKDPDAIGALRASAHRRRRPTSAPASTWPAPLSTSGTSSR